MSVRALRHDRVSGQFSKSLGFSGSVFLSSETIRRYLLRGLFLSNTASVLVIFQNLCSWRRILCSNLESKDTENSIKPR